MENFIDSRSIRIFISSTFRDMDEERKILVSKVFPMLRKMADERQVTLTEVDLRWGITEKESQESKVVQICLEEIDRSYPFFICILGGRYGWCPAEEKVDWETIIPPKYKDAIHDIYEGKSMTELEILHGVFRRKEHVHASFYLHDIPSNEIEHNQQVLREKVSSQNTFPVHPYKNTDELSTSVIRDFQQMLDELYPIESCNSWQSLINQQNYYLHKLTRYYVSNSKAEHDIAEFINQRIDKGLIITGKSGMGKSTIMAQSVLHLLQRDDVDVLSFFSANNANGSTFNDMADWFCRGFSALYNFDYNRDVSHIAEFQRAATTIHPQRKLFLFIDGINQIVTTDDTETDLSWWPTWHENVYVVVSTPSDTEIANNLSRFKYKKIEISQLNLDQRVELANNYLKGDFSKSLSPSQLDIIGRANPLLDNTMIFLAFLDELRRFGSFEKLTQEITTLSSFKTINDFFDHIIGRQRALFLTPKSIEQYDKVLMAIALSYNGLSEDILLELTGISRLNLSLLLGINELYLSTKDGKIVFSHIAFKDAILNFMHHIDKEKLRREIVNVFNSRAEDILNADSLFEIAYQYYQLEDFDRLYVLLSKMSTYSSYSLHGKLNELGRYWTALMDINPHRYDILNIIFNEMADEDSALMSDMMFYVTISIQSDNILNLSNFILNNMERPEAAKRLYNALIKMLENENNEDYENIREAAKQNIAVSSRMEGDYISALKQYKKGIDEHTDMSSAVISNIGELFLTMYEINGNKRYADFAQKILREVLYARIKKYATEEHELVAIAYANYASIISHTNEEYGIELGKRSLSIFERIKGHYSIEVARQYGNIAKQMLKNHLDESIKNAEAALDIYKKLLGENNDNTMEIHWHLALAYTKYGDLDRSWEHARAASALIISKKKKDFIYYLKHALIEFFRKGKYDAAQEVGLYAIPLIEEDDDASIGFHDDLGKIYHLKGLEDLSDEHYEKSIEISLNNKLYQKAQSTLCYYFMKCSETGEIDKAEQNLRRIIEIQDKHDLDESTILAYAYYNIGLLLFRYHEDKEGSIKMIERAIEIRQKLVDEDEKDLVGYKSTLEKIVGVTSTANDEADASSRIAINEMKMILGDTNKPALDAFHEGMVTLYTGNIGQAIHLLNKAQMCLDDDAPASAVAQITRYIAFCEEMKYTNANVSQGDPSKIIALYEKAISIAQEDNNHSLAAKICHDEAMFYSTHGHYASSEKCYWHKLENLLAADEYMSMDTSSTLYNIFMVIYRQGNTELHILFALTAWSLYIYNNIEEQDEDLEERLVRNLQAISEALSDEDIPNIDNWGIHTSILSEYVGDLEDFDSRKLMSSLIKLTSEYCKEIDDIENYIWTRFTYIELTLSLSNNALAMHEIEQFIKDYMAYFDDQTKENVIKTYYRIAIAIHDINKADEICANYSIPNEVRQQHIELITPCTYAFLNGNNEADELYAELQNKEKEGPLDESQYFDLALYCAYKKMPYEGKKYMALWKESISSVPLEYQYYYEPASEMLQNLLEQ